MTNPGPAPKPPVRHPTQDDTRRILIIDDDRRVSELLQITFQGRGFTTEVCRDALAALRRLHDAEREPPDLVVVDLQLEGANGQSLCSRIREEPSTADLPIIVIAGPVPMETRVRVLKWGADDLVTKPFSPRELILRAQKLLERTVKLDRLERRIRAIEHELVVERDARSEAYRSQRLVRRSFVDGIGQLVDLFREDRSLDEGMAQLVARRWGAGPFAYLSRDDVGRLRPVLSRGVSTTALAGLSLAPSSEEGSVMAGPVVFVEDLGEGSPLSPLRPALEASGLSILVVSCVGNDLVGILALGDGVVDIARAPEEADLARCFALAHHALRSRGSRDRDRGLRFAGLLAAWIGAEEGRSRRWKGHSAFVADLCGRLGRSMGVSSVRLEQLTLAGRLHRISVARSSPCGRRAAGHPLILAAGLRPLNGETGWDGVFAILRHQGEWWNGTGAPDGLAGTSIPRCARILAVADAFASAPQAVSSGPAHAIGILRKQSGTRFDPEIVDLAASACVIARTR